MRKSRKSWLMLAVAMICAAAVSRAQWKTAWSYEGAKGPDHWSELDPDYAACNSGKEQSPIDIRNPVKTDLPAIRFEYKSGPLKVINNGYTALRVNYSPGNGNFLVVGDRRYELTQFHFHHPSEEQINGKAYDMVLHLMHAASDGKVAGVAVLLKRGSANSIVRQLWQYMPQTPGKEQEIPGVQVDPAGLLPRETQASTGRMGGREELQRSYYTYEGSQTAPPCTEGVTWFVLKTPVEVSPDQIEAFAKLYPHDVRPVQPLNGRVVKESR